MHKSWKNTEYIFWVQKVVKIWIWWYFQIRDQKLVYISFLLFLQHECFITLVWGGKGQGISVTICPPPVRNKDFSAHIIWHEIIRIRMKSSAKCRREHFFFHVFRKSRCSCVTFFHHFYKLCDCDYLDSQIMQTESISTFSIFLSKNYINHLRLPYVSNHFSLCFHEILNVLLVQNPVQFQEDF